MASNSDSEEVFDEEELADGFDEEIVGVDDLVDADDVDEIDVEAVDVDEDVEGDDTVEVEDEEVLIAVAVPEEEEDVADDADVELALDEVLAETIRRTTTPDELRSWSVSAWTACSASRTPTMCSSPSSWPPVRWTSIS